MSAAASSRTPLLRATARHRIVVSYAVAPDRVEAILPKGLQPDVRDGQAFVNLVGVELVKVRVMGLAGPGFRRVPAVELQVPVQEAETASPRRGTFTIQAYVPRRLVAWGARILYGEPVDVASMQPVWREGTDAIEMTYRFDWAGREQRIRAVGEKPPRTPASDTHASFLMERAWRFGRRRGGTLLRSRIDRIVEPVYYVRERHVTVRWASVYGEEWGVLQDREPARVFVSPGGPLTLYWPERVS